jgi:hypothetical protein
LHVILKQEGNFKGRNFPLTKDTKIMADIILHSVNVYLGRKSEEDKKIELYTQEDINYSSDNNYRHIGLEWFNKSKDRLNIGFSDGKYDEDYDESKYQEENA